MLDFTCNTNYLAPTGFKIIISRSEYPHIQFFAQEVMHPSLDLPSADTPFRRVGNLPFPGDTLTFGQLSMTIMMDEEMKVYEEIYSWLIRLVNEKHKPQTGNLYPGNELSSYADMRLSVLTSHNNPNRLIKYVNVLPVNLGEITFTATSDGQYITFPATFRFDYFELV